MKLFYTLFFCLFILGGCKNKPPKINPLTTADRTILIYMAADNNLYTNGYAESNLSSMRAAIANGNTENTNIVVYIDTPVAGSLPSIFLLTETSEEVIYTYPEEHNSASKEVMQDVIAKVLEFTDTKKYSFVLWSHASSWIPQAVSIKSGQVPYKTQSGMRLQDDFYDYPPTKSFGIATYNGIDSEIDIPDLAQAIPDDVFDYILFDCCYMGSAEVVFELKDKADYIISSPTEIMAEGFPYEVTLEHMSGLNPNLPKVCEEYFNFYNNKSGLSRSATISLYKTSKLEQLANTYKKLLTDNKEDIHVSLYTKVQCFDRYYNHFIYDLRNYAEQFCSEEELAELDASLNEAIVAKFSTDSFINFNIKSYCGVSIYIKDKLNGNYDYANTFYSDLKWDKATKTE